MFAVQCEADDASNNVKFPQAMIASRRRSYFVAVLLGIALVFAGGIPHTDAQESPSSNTPVASPTVPVGITVTPSIAELDLAHEHPDILLYYTNTTPSTIELSFQAQDFTELEDGWRVRFLEAPDTRNYQYGLSSWVDFEQKTLLLNPGETRTMRVRIRQNDLSPGGHYASILAEIRQPGEERAQVPVRGMLSTLLFVRTATGTEREEAQVESLAPLGHPWPLPNEFALRFQNIGNVPLTPHGLLTISDFRGRVVAKGVVNEASLLTLPETVRRYVVPLTPVAPTMFPGRYRADLVVRYGTREKNLSAHSTFLSFGSPLFSALLLIALGAGSVSMAYRRTRSTGVGVNRT